MNFFSSFSFEFRSVDLPRSTFSITHQIGRSEWTPQMPNVIMCSWLHNIISRNIHNTYSMHCNICKYDVLLGPLSRCSLFGQVITEWADEIYRRCLSEMKREPAQRTQTDRDSYEFRRSFCTWATSWTANYDLKSNRKKEDENNSYEKWFRVQREIEKSENFLLVVSKGSRNLSVKKITWVKKNMSEHVR